MTIDPEMLAAYADGALGPEDVARVEAAIAADPELAEQVEAHMGLHTTPSAHVAPILTVPARPTDAPKPRDNVVDLAAVRKEKAKKTQAPAEPPSRTRWIMGGALAAALALGLLLGGRTDPGSSVITRDGQLIASGALDKALTQQLASAQEDAPVRMLISFKDRKGRFCRGFEQVGTAGIACRSGDLWSIERTQAAGGKATADGYRQASSAASAIMAAAREMAAGDALDAQGETAARDSDWRG